MRGAPVRLVELLVEVVAVVAVGLVEAVELLVATGDVEDDVLVVREAVAEQVVLERGEAVAVALLRNAELEVQIGFRGEVEARVAVSGLRPSRGRREEHEPEGEERCVSQRSVSHRLVLMLMSPPCGPSSGR